MSDLNVLRIVRSYTVWELVKSIATGLLFFLIIGSIFVVPIIYTSFLYVPFMKYFLLAIFIVVSFTGSYGWGIVIETLKHYGEYDNINYELFKIRATVALAAITFIVLSIIYIFVT